MPFPWKQRTHHMSCKTEPFHPSRTKILWLAPIWQGTKSLPLLAVLLCIGIKHYNTTALSEGVSKTAARACRAHSTFTARPECKVRNCLESAWKCHWQPFALRRENNSNATCVEVPITAFSHWKISWAQWFPCVAAEFSHPCSSQAQP